MLNVTIAPLEFVFGTVLFLYADLKKDLGKLEDNVVDELGKKIDALKNR